MTGLLAAVQFLTRIPVPQRDYGVASGLVWLPIVGLMLGAILAAVDIGLAWLHVSSLLASAAVVVLLLALSGALHADGLMDTCDATFSHATPERRLEIMRDPRVGAFGAAGFVCVVLLKLTALASLSGLARIGLIILAPGLGRWSIVLLTTAFPYGREHGLGAPFKAAATWRKLALASIAPAAMSAIVGPIGVLAAVVSVAVAYLLARWLLRLLPGLTGDCYGASCEVVETAVWLSGALVLPRLTT